MQLLAAFIRNDNNPGLAAAAVLIGGLLNIFGDVFFVFSMDMGILGAGLVISSALILIRPVLSGPNLLWLAMPVTELLTALYSLAMIQKFTNALPTA